MKAAKTDDLKLVTAIFLASVSIIAYQITLMQYLSIVQWYHFAYMVISIALLGFGASGTLITLFRSWMVIHFEKLFPSTLILSGLSMAMAIPLTNMGFAEFDAYLIFAQQEQLWMLVIYYLINFVPFLFVSLALGLAFVKHVDSIGQLYFADLVGAGLGGLLVLVFFYYFEPGEQPQVIAVLPVLAGLIVFRKPLSNWQTYLSVALFVVIVVLMPGPGDPKTSDFKSISYAQRLPGVKEVTRQNSPHGFIQVLSSDALRHAPGLSLKFQGQIPSQTVVFNNGNWLGVIPDAALDSVIYYSMQSFPYHFAKRQKVLVLNSGTGEELKRDIYYNSDTIVFTEANKELNALNKGKFAQWNDSLFYNPKLAQHNITPRTFLAQEDVTFDLIQLPTLGSFGGDAGLFALKEEFLLTREAFDEMWRQLSPHGSIIIPVYLQYPPRYSLRLVATAYEMLEAAEVQAPVKHLLAIRNWNMMLLMISKSPISTAEKERILDYCEKFNFDITILHGTTTDQKNRYNELNDPLFFAHLDSLSSPKARKNLFEAYDFNIRPVTDDKPYFTQFLRWTAIANISRIFGEQTLPFFELGYLIVIVTLTQLTLLAFLLIITPLFRLRNVHFGRLQTVLYFSGLGFGFMFLEMVFIEMHTLYLGQEIFSAAIVLAIMLVSSGAGSYFSARLTAEPFHIKKLISLLTIIFLIYIVGLESIISVTLGWPFSIRILIAAITIFIPAVIMGTLFPLGLRLTASRGEALVPWAWGINGATSVVATGLALVIAVELGFRAVMMAALLCYLLALVSLRFVKNNP